ncbi:hypothetical protein DP23_4381 [Ralstonia pickettii]|nr:hypothetical protein DP23_4381 [Ralstonia pickettii]
MLYIRKRIIVACINKACRKVFPIALCIRLTYRSVFFKTKRDPMAYLITHRHPRFDTFYLDLVFSRKIFRLAQLKID